ncbi:MAG: hypothetical protein WD669_03150 [Pirellulales bacterium]
MDLNSEFEVANTVEKLTRLEARYEALRNDAVGDQRLRALSMTSLARMINQFKEEIARYHAGASNGGRRGRMLQNEREVANTQIKLRRLEERREKLRNEADGDEHSRKMSMESLTRLINQFKEDIARYQAHHGVRS